MKGTEREGRSGGRPPELVRLEVWTLVAAVVALTFGFLATIG